MTSDYSSESIRELYERNFDSLYRVCYMYMKNIHDTEDAVHNACLLYTSIRVESLAIVDSMSVDGGCIFRH